MCSLFCVFFGAFCFNKNLLLSIYIITKMNPKINLKNLKYNKPRNMKLSIYEICINIEPLKNLFDDFKIFLILYFHNSKNQFK